jgi:polysaccharide pyruvyl transferase WcaK-like protein
MKVLVDHDGYDLLNLGGVAMLQACVVRLRQQWPDADIRVIAHAPDRLREYCPGTTAIGRTFADSRYIQIFPRKVRLASEQLWRIAGPQLRPAVGRRHRGDAGPRTAIEAVRWADVVVAAGGGYLTDTWWWHAAGVLSLLDLAQSLGKPTAMFGQGIGPLRGRALRALARKVVPKLTVLGLREQVTGLGLALSFGTSPDVIRVTGDDAIEVIPSAAAAPAASALGVNIREADYAGIGGDSTAIIGESLMAAARDLGAPIIALPVSRYPTTSDLDAIGACLRAGLPTTDVTLADLPLPADLASAAVRCRAIVTGSYHAAVFALSQGVPAVCLTGSSYYDAKFAGLSALFPEACQVISLAAQDPSHVLRSAIARAWDLPPAARSAALEAAERQRAAGREAYADFRATVDLANAAHAPASR